MINKKELKLDGIHCAGCASKIEKNILNIEGIISANINFANGILTLEANPAADLDNLTIKSIKIIKDIEPHIIISEKSEEKFIKKELFLDGLSCGHCASKIDTEIKKIENIKSSHVDFPTSKLYFEIKSKNEVDTVITKIKDIIKKIEPHVIVTDTDDNKKMDTHSHEHGHDHSHEEEHKNFIKLGTGLAIFIIAMIFKFSNLIEFILYTISYLIVGGEILLRAINNIKRGDIFDENFLMSIATVGAFAIGQYPEGVAVMIFYQIGEILQGVAVNRSRKSISDLMDIRPDFANIEIGETIKKVSPEEVSIGDVIIVKPGEKIPLDGKVINGTSALDTSALTGESLPRTVTIGESVLSGSINKNGLLSIKVEKEFRDSTVAKILEMVQNASSKKAPTEKFITKFAKYYTPAVVFAALALAVLPPLFIEGATFSQWIYRALSFLVVSCPCALVVSIPLGFFGGIGSASKKGILIKGGNYLEALYNAEVVVFDKTGTLTKGVFKVTQIHGTNGFSDKEIITYAAYAENFSNHPIATSILNAYGEQIEGNRLKNHQEIEGHGIKVLFNEKELLVGNDKLMKNEGILHNDTKEIGTIVHVAINKVYAGYIVISDEIKEDSYEAIKLLKSIGIKDTIMLTGDNRKVAKAVGEKLKLDEIYWELLPNEKVEKLEVIEKKKSPKGKLIFVGDGINDAPVLTRADIGIAMGGVGSDAAIEAADVVIMTDEPSKIATAIKIAKKTRKIVIQNIVFALGIKIILLILVAMGLGTMWEAVFGDVGVTLLAVLNSMRVLKD